MKKERKSSLKFKQIQLIHLCSPAFPTGAFSHSYGYETLFEEGYVCDLQTYRRYLRAMLLSGTGKTDAGMIRFSYQEPQRLSYWDELCTALKPTAELRLASKKTGNSFLKMFSAMYPENSLSEREFINRNYAVVFGAVSRFLELPLEDAIEGYLCGMMLSAIQVGIKLIPLSQADGQILMKECYPEILECVESALTCKEDDLFAFVPMTDIASMHHEYQYSRMYMS